MRGLEQNGNTRMFGKDDILLGHEVVEIPFIWVPDDCDEPRPGYPWFEAGRMTLSAEQLAAWPPSGRVSRRGGAGAGPDATSVDQRADATASVVPPGAGSGDVAADDEMAAAWTGGAEPFSTMSERARSYGDSATQAVCAAIQALDALSDPGLGSTVLDAASQRSAAARFASLGWSGGINLIGSDRPQNSAGAGGQPQYRADVNSLPDKPTYIGANHECVAMVREVTGASEAKAWAAGANARGNQAILPGTAIATFRRDGHYSGHAAIYLGQNARGLIVFDQWAGKGGSEHPGQVRVIEFRAGRGEAADDGDQFHIVVPR